MTLKAHFANGLPITKNGYLAVEFVDSTPGTKGDTPVSGNEMGDLTRLMPANPKGGTVTKANTSQLLSPENHDRKSLRIQNISDGDLWVREGAPAGVGVVGSFLVKPGQFYEAGSFSEVSIAGAAAGQKYSALETFFPEWNQ